MAHILPRTIQLTLLLIASCTLLACSAQDRRLDEHVLQRAAYGPDAASLVRLAALGVDGWLDEQLHPETLPDGRLDRALAQYPSLGLTLQQLDQGYGDQKPLGPYSQPLEQLQEAKVIRAVLSQRQLEAILTDFWFDHFNVYASEGVTVQGVVPYEREAIRPHVLGRFEDLLRAVARSPAMLDYLDNDVNVVVVIDESGQQTQGLNENWARELMELHTLGVDGGYTQADVIEVARCFTGWGVAFDWQLGILTPDGFAYDPSQHDDGAKSLFGGALDLPSGGGMADADAVLHYLATHPKTAARVARLLVQRFVDEIPPQRLVDEAAARFLASGGDLREVMRTILFSPEFRDVSRHRGKVKRPLVLLASMLRVSGADPTTFAREIVWTLDDLGEEPYGARPPTGYPDASGYWSNGGALVKRMNEATWHASEALARSVSWSTGGGTPVPLVNVLAARLLPGGLSPASHDAIVAYLAGLPQWVDADKQVEEAAGLLLSTPEFQKH